MNGLTEASPLMSPSTCMVGRLVVVSWGINSGQVLFPVLVSCSRASFRLTTTIISPVFVWQGTSPVLFLADS